MLSRGGYDMIQLICLNCGGFTYFDIEVEALRAIEVNDNGLIVDDAIIDDWNYSDETLRGNLDDMVNYVLKQPNETINSNTENTYITCARCNSRKVTVPYMDWHPPHDPISISEEIIKNRNEYHHLRKERDRDHYLPVLWQ